MLHSVVIGGVVSAVGLASFLLMRLSSHPGLRFVDRWLLLVFRACPLRVSSDLGKCLVITLGVRPGNDAYVRLMVQSQSLSWPSAKKCLT